MEHPEPSPAAPHPQSAKPDGNNPTNPACDQCRLRKIRCNRESPECLNCRKAGVPCETSNRGKRVNQTRQLLEDFSGLGARLDSIDRSLAEISRRVSVADHTSPSSASRECEDDDLDPFYRRQESECSEQDATTSQQAGGLHQTSHNGESHQRYESTSALCLIQSCRRGLEKILGMGQVKRNGPLTALVASDVALRTELRALYNSYPFVEDCPEPDFSSDGKAVSGPPRSFIHTVIDSFMTSINTARPVFQESRLRLAIEDNDSDEVNESSNARNLCFSNIILLTLSLKSSLARRDHSNGNGMDDDLLMSFWKNSRRAFSHLDTYLEPRLINVQALATLAMVAREHCESQVFERLCHMACLVAKSIGLHRLHSNPKGAMNQEDKERIQLFWALYVMDKERVFMTGQPCDFYTFDTDVQLLEWDVECTLQHYKMAHNHLMSLWEDIYISLYSSGAMRKGSVHRYRKVAKLSTLFRNWRCKYKVLFNTPFVVQDLTKSCLQIELKYCFNVGQILIHRCGRDETSKQQRIDSVYAALNIIKEIHGTNSNLGKVALLGRIFRCYPSVAFLDLHDRILETPESTSPADVELLTTVAEALDSLKDPNFPQAYCSKLHIAIEWCIKVARAMMISRPQSPTAATPESSAERCESVTPESIQPQKPQALSKSSSPTFSNKAHSPSQDESTRPRKKRAPQWSIISSKVHPRDTSHPPTITAGTDIPDSGPNILSVQPYAPLVEENHIDAVSAPLFLSPAGSEHQAWSSPFTHPNEAASVNMPNLSGTAGAYYPTGTFNDFMLNNGSVMEPWQMDLTNVDGVHAQRFDGWPS